MCEGCVANGYLSRFVYDVIEAFSERYPDSNYGNAHIVIDDCNVGDSNIRWCLDRIGAAEPEHGFLLWLLTVPQAARGECH